MNTGADKVVADDASVSSVFHSDSCARAVTGGSLVAIRAAGSPASGVELYLAKTFRTASNCKRTHA